MSPSTFYASKGPCTVCFPRKNGAVARRSQETFEKDVKNHLGESYEVVGIYQSLIKAVLVEHTTCRSTYKIIPKYMYEGYCRCKCEKEVN